MNQNQKNKSYDYDNNKCLSLIKGIILGMSMIIPGVSGGTILVIFGIYEQLISDILKLNIKPYLMLGAGSILGVLLGSKVITFLFDAFRNPTSAFILGCILMSVPFILKRGRKHHLGYVGLLIMGFILSFSLIAMNADSTLSSLSSLKAILGGIVSSSTMLIPGVSGSAALIVLGIYESLLEAITSFNIKIIILYLIGALLGFVITAKIMKKIFQKYQVQILYFFSGMILGSSRLLFPSEINIISFGSFLIGASVVYKWGRGSQSM